MVDALDLPPSQGAVEYPKLARLLAFDARVVGVFGVADLACDLGACAQAWQGGQLNVRSNRTLSRHRRMAESDHLPIGLSLTARWKRGIIPPLHE